MQKPQSILRKILTPGVARYSVLKNQAKTQGSRRPTIVSMPRHSDMGKGELSSLTEEPASSIFAQDSTTVLLKKFMVYKLMGSDLFINHALTMMNLSYRVFGIRPTNFVINQSVGSLFTAGETIETLIQDTAELQKKNIDAIGNYVVEGMAEMDLVAIEQTYQQIMDAIEASTEGKSEGHFAIKLTALISTDVMTRLNGAQAIFANDILNHEARGSMDVNALSSALAEHGVKFTHQEVEVLFEYLKFESSEDRSTISPLEAYANGHLFRLDVSHTKYEEVRGLLKRVALGCGAGVSENDL